MPPRAGAGGPSSQARQSEGPKRSQGRGSTGATGSGRRGKAGPMAAGGGPAPVFLGLQRVQPAGGAGGVGGAGAGRRVRLAAARMLCAPPRALKGAPSPRAPLGGRADPDPAWTHGNTCALGPAGAGGAGGWGARSAVEGASVLLGRFGCVRRTPRQSGGEDGGRTSTHSVALGRARRACSLSPGLEGAAGRARCADSGLPLPGVGVGGSGVTLRLFPDGTEARNFVSFLP